MRLIHKLGFALSVITFALFVAALPTIWYGTDISGHVGDSSATASVHLTLWQLKLSGSGSTTSKSWKDILYNDDVKDEKFCPDKHGDDDPTNADAYHIVATAAAMATLGMIFGFAFVIIGFAYGVAKLPSRVAVGVVGGLAVLCSIVSFAAWIHFIEMCDHGCEQFNIGGDFAGANKSCSYGIGFVFEIICAAGSLVALILFVAAKPVAEGDGWYQRMK